MSLKIEDMKRERENLTRNYELELARLEEKVTSARKGLKLKQPVSNHDAFNMSAVCQNLAVLAGKIKQTENVIRWMEAI